MRTTGSHQLSIGGVFLKMASPSVLSYADSTFWVSDYRPIPSARDFIRRCLTIDATQRMTAHDALSHPFVAKDSHVEKEADLLPVVKKNFNARRTLHTAIDTIRAINKLREGGNAALMASSVSTDPSPSSSNRHGPLQDGDVGSGGGSGSSQDRKGKDTPLLDRSTPTPSNQGLWQPPSQS